MAAYAPDTWYTPIVIDSTNNGIVITEDPGGVPNVLTVTVDAGTYFMHDDSSFHTSRPGLLYAIQELLNNGTTAGVGTLTGGPAGFSYSWEVSDPTGSTGLTDNGITLRATAPGNDFEITWTNASSTMDARWFGNTLQSPIVDQASSTDGADEIVQWSRATKHRMVTRNLCDNIAIDKRREHYKDQRRSSSSPKDANAVIWDEGFFRLFVYEDVYGQEVHEDRASEAEWAALTGRATGDNHATWFLVWDALTNNREVIVVNNDSDDLQIDANSYEVGKLWDDVGWSGMFTRTEPGADLYDVRIPLWVDPDLSDYDH